MQLKQASVHVLNSSGDRLIASNPQLPLVPASTIKLLTAYLAIKTWGLQHRFSTEFYLDDNNNLWIKGLGDPYLISEELDIIVAQLKKLGLNTINNLNLDSSFFDANIQVDGQSSSNNPYDAPLGALAVNFNTINVRVGKQGTISAEAQTPITPLAKQLSAGLVRGKHRINLGSADLGPRYFAEIFSAKLRQQRIIVSGSVGFSSTPQEIPLYYRHRSSRTLEAVIAAMLKYSNNFIANQLYLLIGAEHHSSANMRQSSTAFKRFTLSTFGWKNMSIHEGAGLSRHNSMSAQQLTDLLVRMKPYAHLLPEKEAGIVAKTGTLNGVKTYAGYFRSNNELLPFAIMINSNVSWEFRRRVAQQLRIRAIKINAQ